MKFTLSWLKQHLDTDATLDQIVEKLTMIGLEVEHVEDRARTFAPFKVVEVISAVQHPNADRLRVCMVDTGDGAPIQVVCGAPNARGGMKAVLGRPGTYIPGKDITLGVGKIRGVESHGMLISGAEIKFNDDHDGIIEMPADAPVGTPFAQVIGADDPVIEINLTPNRADCTGVSGIARDLGATGIGKFIENAPKPVKGAFPCPVSVKLDFGDTPSLCPGFALRLVKGVKNGPSPEWLQKRLTAIGLRPINALVDITNYMTFDRGRPLHVFDAAKVRGNLTVRRAKAGEEVLALDGRTYKLDETMCVIADEKGVESLSGVMGGEETGCAETTTDVLIESALWVPLNIAQTGRKLGINSDARYRFERGVDPNFMVPGLEEATKLARRGPADRCPGQRSQAPHWPRRAACRNEARARPSRLLRRRQRAGGEGRRPLLARRRRRQGGYRRGGRAHRRARQRALDRIPAPRIPAQAGADAAAEPQPQGQARACRARPQRGRHLVVHRQVEGRIVRRRQHGARAGQSHRRRSLRHAAEPPARPRGGGAAQRRPRLRRHRDLRGRADLHRR
jgi:phenylalanyl-tRNA synthetase beta chain